MQFAQEQAKSLLRRVRGEIGRGPARQTATDTGPNVARCIAELASECPTELCAVGKAALFGDIYDPPLIARIRKDSMRIKETPTLQVMGDTAIGFEQPI